MRGQSQRNRGRSSGTMCTCEEMERGTHACKASKLGPIEQQWTQDGKLGITIQDNLHTLEDGHIYCILLIRIAFCHVSKNLPLDCLFHVTINIYFCFYINAERDVVTVLLIFATCIYVSLYIHIFTCTYRGTQTPENMYNTTQEEWRQQAQEPG